MFQTTVFVLLSGAMLSAVMVDTSRAEFRMQHGYISMDEVARSKRQAVSESVGQCPGGIPSSEVTGFLTAHNKLRQSITAGTFTAKGKKMPAALIPIPNLNWDCDLEKSAQAVASTCANIKTKRGQSTYTSAQGVSFDGQGKAASEAWAAKFQKNGWPDIEFTISDMQLGIMEATQMAWAKTTKIGCGMAKCQDGKQLTIVCQYRDVGNTIAQNVYEPAVTSSEKCFTPSKVQPSKKTPPTPTVISPEDGLPNFVDWREQGAVTEVKKQGLCGGCYSFATTGTIEGQLAIHGKGLISLSEQNILDCSTRNQGCQGGTTSTAIEFVKSNGGIATEEAYPYTSCGFLTNSCRASNASKFGGEITGFEKVNQFEDGVFSLKWAVAKIGPIAAAIDASHKSFADYSSGVYYEPACSSSALTHGVLVVGYGTDPVHGDYWLIKNSWGTSWGEQGYARLARNKDNHCGIATDATYPTM